MKIFKAISAITIFFLFIVVSVSVYAYLNKQQPVLYRRDYVDCCPTIFLQNPFRDKSEELAVERFLSQLKGKTVTEALENNKDVGFNNPKGQLEYGTLVKWELMNRIERGSGTDFYYAIYRDDKKNNPDQLLLSFSVIRTLRAEQGFNVISYKCEGISNNS